jgi:hypothetical protein
MVYTSNTYPNNVGLDEYGIQTNLKPKLLDLMTSKLIMFISMQLFKYLCTHKSLPIHLQLYLFKFFDSADVCDYEYGLEFW